MISIDIAVLTLNEERYIGSCLSSILNFAKPENVKIKIFIIDGGSTDKTLEIIKNDFLSLNESIEIIQNKKKIQSAGMNLMIKQSQSDYLLRIDSHCIYDKNYLKNCLDVSIKTNADNVGGVIETVVGDSSYSAQVVQAISSHIFGVGNSNFRIGSKARYVDTVPFGFFKSSIFSKVGIFDERLVRAQDYEFNRRIIKEGGKIFLDPSIKVKYFNQVSFLKFLKKIFYLEAPYNSYMWYFSPYTFSIRHSITLFFFIGLIGGLITSFFSKFLFITYILIITLYWILALISSTLLTIKFNQIRHFFLLPFCFFLYHLTHGAGVALGLLKIMLNKIPKS